MTYNDIMGDVSRPASPIRRLIRRYRMYVSGFLLFAGSAFLATALVTWKVDDPSLSNATDQTVRNLAGYPGAIAADLLMQFLGLAAASVVIVCGFMGASLLRRRAPRSAVRQAGYAVLGVLFASAALACLPVAGRWPIPTGLGGATGDLMLRIPASLLAMPVAGGLKAALGVLFASIGTGLLVAACARTAPLAPVAAPVRPPRDDWQDGPLAPGRDAYRDDDTDDDHHNDHGGIDEDERDSRLRLLAGGAMHFALTAKTAVRRIAARARRTGRAFGHAEGIALPDFDRAEPGFAGDWADEEPRPASGPADEPANPTRVREMAPPPRPGKRASRAAAVTAPPVSDSYELPPLPLLDEPKAQRQDASLSPQALEQNARLLEGVLEDFGVRGEIINIRPGPVVTMYELEPAPGIKSSRVIGLADDIARSMSAIAARVAVIPGRNVIGIELPNHSRETVYLREMLGSDDFEKTRARLALALGKTIGGEPVIADLAKMPHLLVAGTTGSGKSVSINTMILSILYRLTPEQCRLIMIDPKMLELSVYDGIPHLLTPVVTDPKKAVVALKWTVREMEERYKKMSRLGVRNVDGFNQRIAVAAKKGEEITRTVQTGFDHETGEAIFETETLDLEPMPFIVVIIDEMADLMMVAGKDIEGAVQRLAQMARAAGIHVIMATQRPSVDVITGTIKANFPTRISFQVTSKIDSRTILGEQGAEQLLGMGDMLFMAGGGRIQRVHGPFVSDEEVEQIVAHLKAQGLPEYLESVIDEDEAASEGGFESAGFGSPQDDADDPYDQAVAVVLRDRKVSTSYIQRRLSIGYNRAASLVERMEKEGVIGAANHAGKREILVPERDESGAAV